MSRPLRLLMLDVARRLLPRDVPLVVAVSGGGDSVALLHLLHELPPSLRPPLRVAHLDHGLRDASLDDRQFVEQLAARLGLPCVGERRSVVARRGESPMEAARRVRREFLLADARRDAALVATAHTIDDQAETILMRWARGAGATALNGMAERGPGPLVRPLLGVRREELRDWLRSRNLDWHEDPTNFDRRHQRSRVRHDVLPLLAATLNPSIVRHLVGAAARAKEDADYLDLLAAERMAALGTRSTDGSMSLEAAGLATLPSPLAGRVAARAMRHAGLDARHVTARHVAALIDLARGAPGRRIDLPDGRRAVRQGAVLLIGRRSGGVRSGPDTAESRPLVD